MKHWKKYTKDVLKEKIDQALSSSVDFEKSK